jgi:hypothetical protein
MSIEDFGGTDDLGNIGKRGPRVIDFLEAGRWRGPSPIASEEDDAPRGIADRCGREGSENEVGESEGMLRR